MYNEVQVFQARPRPEDKFSVHLFVAKKKSTKSVATNALLGPALTARKSHVLDKKSRAIF